jgi:hypothetical protein
MNACSSPTVYDSRLSCSRSTYSSLKLKRFMKMLNFRSECCSLNAHLVRLNSSHQSCASSRFNLKSEWQHIVLDIKSTGVRGYLKKDVWQLQQ